MHGVGVRADPSAPMSPGLDVTVTVPGVALAPAGVAGQDAADAADWALVLENHGLLLCRSSLPEEVAAGAAAVAPACRLFQKG